MLATVPEVLTSYLRYTIVVFDRTRRCKSFGSINPALTIFYSCFILVYTPSVLKKTRKKTVIIRLGEET